MRESGGSSLSTPSSRGRSSRAVALRYIEGDMTPIEYKQWALQFESEPEPLLASEKAVRMPSSPSSCARSPIPINLTSLRPALHLPTTGVHAHTGRCDARV